MSESGIRDNHNFGKVGDFLKEKIYPNAQLRFVSAYFSIFGFEALKEELLPIDKLQFLFGEPTFVKPLDALQSQAKALPIKKQATTPARWNVRLMGWFMGFMG